MYSLVFLCHRRDFESAKISVKKWTHRANSYASNLERQANEIASLEDQLLRLQNRLAAETEHYESTLERKEIELALARKECEQTLNEKNNLKRKYDDTIVERNSLAKQLESEKKKTKHLQSGRSHWGGDDFLEPGECIEKNGVAIQKADNFSLLQEILRKNELLNARDKQIEEAKKEHAVEKERLESDLAIAQRRMNFALDQLKQMRDEREKSKEIGLVVSMFLFCHVLLFSNSSHCYFYSSLLLRLQTVQIMQL